MAWTRIDDKFLMNPKIQSAGAYGLALYLSGLIYCNTNLTDGYIPDVMLPALCGLAFQTPSKNIAKSLVDLNLWEHVPGGYLIHDFLTFNKSKVEIETLNKQRADNGAKGGRKPNRVANQNGKQTGSTLLTESEPINPNTLIPLLKQQPLSDARNVFSVYENSIAVLNPHMAEVLKSAIEDYSEDWVIEAIKEAVENNKRNWRYCEAVLRRWQVDGFKVDTRTKPKVNNNGHKSLSPELDEILKGAPIFAEDER